MREADLLVTLLTRAKEKCRGVAAIGE